MTALLDIVRQCCIAVGQQFGPDARWAARYAIRGLGLSVPLPEGENHRRLVQGRRLGALLKAAGKFHWYPTCCYHSPRCGRAFSVWSDGVVYCGATEAIAIEAAASAIGGTTLDPWTMPSPKVSK